MLQLAMCTSDGTLIDHCDDLVDEERRNDFSRMA